MGDMTVNISRKELACKCKCGDDSMDFETITVLQGACDYFAFKYNLPKVTLVIHSAYRCLKYNRKPASEGGPGSNDRSQHPRARAIDFHIVEVPLAEVYDYLDTMYHDKYGLGKYDSFIHIDTRTNGPARW